MYSNAPCEHHWTSKMKENTIKFEHLGKKFTHLPCFLGIPNALFILFYPGEYIDNNVVHDTLAKIIWALSEFLLMMQLINAGKVKSGVVPTDACPKPNRSIENKAPSPKGLMSNILRFLPAVVLYNVRYMCRQWGDIIHAFIETHSLHTNAGLFHPRKLLFTWSLLCRHEYEGCHSAWQE